MAQHLFARYFADVRDKNNGESYSTIFRYFWPEFITALILSALLQIVDGVFIAHLKSTSMYATLGVTSTLLHFITKLAEGAAIGTMILCGQYNGIGDYKQVGRAAITGMWVTIALGALISGLIAFAAPWIYVWYEVPPKMMLIGTQFLRLRAVSIFLSFVFFACVGFLRGIKNTRLPMILFVIGGAVFIVCDYLLIFGAYGFPQMKLFGSAIASIVQYTVMLFGAFGYVFLSKKNNNYHMNFAQSYDSSAAHAIIHMSWPVMIDKAILAGAKMWLAKMIGPMGKTALASFTVIKDMEQLAFVPAIACAQVITFLVSNDYSQQNWLGIKNNIKRVIVLASIMVFSILLLFSYAPHLVIRWFDTKHIFGTFAATAFPLLSVLVFFDLLQLILAGALRGASDVKTVMMVRLVTCLLFFCPCSWLLTYLPIENPVYKFVVVYGSFYISNALMSIMYFKRFKGHAWKYNGNLQPSRKADDQDYEGRSTQISQDVEHSHL